MRKLEFLICGSPNDAFWSQLAMLRLSLDSLGPEFQSARLVMVLGDMEIIPVPDRWKPFFTNIEIEWAPVESFLEFGDGSDHLFTLIDPSADITFICDADTLLIREIPTDFLDEMIQTPAISGVIAHYRPPKTDQYGNDHSRLNNSEFWQNLSRHVLGRDIELPNDYTLKPTLGRCPFYINYGFVASTPRLLIDLHKNLSIVQPKIRAWLDNEFYAQIGIAMAVQLGNLRSQVLPMRFNFPNDPIADDLYPGELRNVVLIHYLRCNVFDRHLIFANEANFNGFMSLELHGSNAVFQQRIRDLTGSVYPF